MAFGVYAGVAYDERFACRSAGGLAFGRGRNTTEYSFDAGSKLATVERLGHIVVGTQLQANNLVEVFVAGGEHDYGDIALAPYTLADLPAVNLGQHQIEHYQRGLCCLELVECLGARVGGLDGIALFAQVE